MIGLQDFDLLAIDRAAELLCRHARRFHGAGPHGGGEYAVHVGENADADGVALDLGLRERGVGASGASAVRNQRANRRRSAGVRSVV